MEYDIKIGDIVVKHSGKPFKKAEGASEALTYDEVEGYADNPQDPLNRPAAKLKISQTLVSLYQLKVKE